jgi:hypothetical protein
MSSFENSKIRAITLSFVFDFEKVKPGRMAFCRKTIQPFNHHSVYKRSIVEIFFGISSIQREDL